MKKIVCVVLSVLMMGVCAGAGAPEVEQEREAEIRAAERLKNLEIMTGDENGNLNLSKNLTRAEFAVLMDKAGCFLGNTYEQEINFNDVTSEHWAYRSITNAVNAGVVSGFGDGTFRPDEPVLYEQAVRMVMSTLIYDAEYPIGYIGKAVDFGIVDEVRGTIGEELDRGNAAVLIKNFLDYEASAENDEFSGNSFKQLGGGGSGGASYLMGVSESVSFDSSGGSISGNAGVYPMPRPDVPEYCNSEEYDYKNENIFKSTMTSPLSTFSIDVDTASYSNVRRFLTGGNIPDSGAARVEELINYFDYKLPQPEGDNPFSVTAELHECPWNSENRLAMISLKGRELSEADALPNNLVFLIDTSGSMYSYNKLPLVQRSLDLLLDNLGENDTVSIVTYAGSAGVALEPTSASDRRKISDAVNSLRAFGSTAGAQGIETAYKLAEEHKTDGNNRIILCTDGDFNVGITDNKSLEDLISEKKETGIFLTVLGFGMGNYKDGRMEMLADCGNGNYAYIDTLKEAKKVLADDLDKTLYTIAKDVKIQAEFNPAQAAEYRLVGYENRVLENEDFENDAKDAGEIGAGHSVTVFYEIVPAGENHKQEQLRYSTSVLSDSDELMHVKIRYKEPDGDESKLMEYTVEGENSEIVSENYLFASAVAEFGMLINKSEFLKDSSFESVKARAKQALGEDEFGIRNEFVQLVDIADWLFKK